MTTATAAYTRPWLADYQTEALFCAERYAVVEASTKAGKTVACLIWLSEQAFRGQAGHNYWWVAPVYDQAAIAYRRLKRMLPLALYTSNETHLTITLANGAVIWFRSAEKPDNLYGEDVYAAVVDEASRCREEAWHALRSTLTATHGPVRLIGNVKGRRNWAYHLARRAEAGEPDMHYAKITAYDAIRAGILTDDEVRDAQRMLPEAVFAELYLAEPTDLGQNPFGIAAIQRCLSALSGREPFAWGWDLAKSVDWTVGIALDEDGQVCRFLRFQQPWEETITEVHRQTGGIPALIDSTGVGDPIVERLQRTIGPHIEGYKFTAQSKQRLFEGLSVAVQRAEIGFPDGPIRTEMEAFEYEYTRIGVRYRAPEGMHDDCPVALALAVQKWQERRHFRPVGVLRPAAPMTARRMVQR